MSQTNLVWILLSVILSTVFKIVQGGLTLNKECGELVCEAHYFCSPTDHTCRPCEDVCGATNNHDQKRCESDCQDYLHDIRYLKSKDPSSIEMQIESELWTLKLLIGVTIGMTTTLMILTVIILLKLHFKKSNTTKKKQVLDIPAVIYSNKFEKSSHISSSRPPSASVVINSNPQLPENNNSARFRREPSESTLPEYSSYDNPALSPSPTHHV